MRFREIRLTLFFFSSASTESFPKLNFICGFGDVTRACACHNKQTLQITTINEGRIPPDSVSPFDRLTSSIVCQPGPDLHQLRTCSPIYALEAVVVGKTPTARTLADKRPSSSSRLGVTRRSFGLTVERPQLDQPTDGTTRVAAEWLL